jgi:signal recognition particle receptor subunit beta
MTETVSTTPTADLATRTVALVKSVAEAARTAANGNLVRGLQEESSRWTTAEMTVVIVGEAKRGKSSLVNALLGHPGLCPVGADITTNTYFVIHGSDQPMAQVHREGAAGPEVVDVPIEQLEEWATAEQNPSNRKRVRVVELGVPHPILSDGLRLVDTPGVGGLDAAHSAIALTALADADALIFVVDATAPFSQSELTFLRGATERIGTVLFVLAKKDLFRGWRTILDDNRELLAQHAPEFAESEWLPTSSLIKLHADSRAAAGEIDRACILERESGILQLDAWLRERVLGQSRLLRLSNLIRLASNGIHELELPEQAIVEGASEDSQLRESLVSYQSVLREFSRMSATWVTTLSDEFLLLDMDVRRDLMRLTSDLQRRYETKIAQNAPSLLETLPQSLEADLTTLLARLTDTLQQGIGEIIKRLSEQFAIKGMGIALSDMSAGAAPSIDDLGAPQRPSATVDWTTRLQTFQIVASSGSGLRSLLMFAGPGVATGPVGVLGGLAIGALLFKRNQAAVEKTRTAQAARQFLNEQLTWLRTEIPNEIQRLLLRLRRKLEADVRERLEKRGEEIKRALDDQQRMIHADQATREQTKSAALPRLQRLDELRHDADSLIRDLQTAYLASAASTGGTA